MMRNQSIFPYLDPEQTRITPAQKIGADLHVIIPTNKIFLTSIIKSIMDDHGSRDAGILEMWSQQF
jgi:hypothetical protein